MCKHGLNISAAEKNQSDIILFISKLSTQVTKYNEHIYLHLDYEVWQHPRSRNVTWTDKTTNFVYNTGLEKYRTEKIPHTRIQDSRSPLENFWTYGLKMENQYCEPNLGNF